MEFRPAARTALAILLLCRAAGGQTPWKFLGPQPAGQDAGALAGRVTALAVDPRDPEIAYLGSAGGGVWKTTDGGRRWTALTDTQVSLVIGALALDPSNPDIVYAGTGEANACDMCLPGAGILKSTDGGASWTHIAGSFVVGQFARGARFAGLAVHESGKVLLAAVYFVGVPGLPGIYRSADEGRTWKPVLNSQQGTAVAFDPAQADLAWAGVYGKGVWRSTDAGLTWKEANGEASPLPVENIARVALALTPARPGTIYASVASADPADNDGLKGIYRSEDSGATWTRLPAPDYCRPKCSYANVFAADPADANTLWAGGPLLLRSSDAGTAWEVLSRAASGAGLHVDQHAFAFAGDGSLYVGNDGGVYRAAGRLGQNPGWRNLNRTLAIAQFYGGLALDPVNPQSMFGGAQGIGSVRYSGSLEWDSVGCREGGGAVVDISSPNNIYVACALAQVRRSANRGDSWVPAADGIDAKDRMLPAPPLVPDPRDSRRLYLGTNRVYQSTDGAGSWVAVSPDLGEGSAAVSAIAISPLDSRVAWAGTTAGRVYVSLNADGGLRTFWTARDGGLPRRPVTAITASPRDVSTAFAAVGGYAGGDSAKGHVFRTRDHGETWQDISGGLPDMPVFDLLVDPDLEDTLYAALEGAVFRTTDGGRNWEDIAAGLPRAAVTSLRLHRTARLLRIATYGRGAWELPVPLPDGINNAPAISRLTPAVAAPGARLPAITIAGTGFAAGAEVRWNGQRRPAAREQETLVAQLEDGDIAGAAIARVTVWNPGPGGGESNPLYFTVASPPAIRADSAANAASFERNAAAPGSLATIFGSNLAIGTYSGEAVPLPKMLGGASVRIGGYAAPLLFVSPSQISFQVPWEVSGLDSAIMQVTVGSLDGPPQSLRLRDFSPGIFTLSQAGGGQGAVTIGDSTALAAPSDGSGGRPVRRGEAISIFCTGLGQVDNRPASGSPAAAVPLSAVTRVVTVRFGTVETPAAFAGLTPGLVGVYQVNVLVPEDAPSGDSVPLNISAGGIRSNVASIAITGEP